MIDYGEMMNGSSSIFTGHKQASSIKKMLKSAGSALGADEIDSECRTNGDDSDHLSATQTTSNAATSAPGDANHNCRQIDNQ